jgi:hypothetical protein
MRSIGKLFTAFATVADSLLALASVIDTATARLRMQLALDTDPPGLPHGEVLDNAETDSGSPSTKRGKKTAAV